MPKGIIQDISLIFLVWQALNSVLLWEECRKWERVVQKKRPKRQKRKRRTAEEFKGLTKKPVCEQCEAEKGPKVADRQPPPMIESQVGAPRTVDTSHHFCDHKKCLYYGWLNRGNIIANGHPNGGKSRQMYCKVCKSYFVETLGTIFYGGRIEAQIKMWAILSLAEGLGIQGVSRVFGIKADTVHKWLVAASEHTVAFSNYVIHDLRLTQVQLDELYGLVREIKAEEADPEQQGKPKKNSLWVWAAVDAVTKLMVSVVVGDRRLPMAQELVHDVADKLADDCQPLFLTDGLPAYATAILTHFGHWTQPARQSNKGPAPKPRWTFLPNLNYAQVIKKRLRRRIVKITKHVVCGSLERIKAVLEPYGWQINTSFIERFNLTFRQHVPALGRRTNTLAKSKTGLRRQCLLVQTYYNFCLPHASLRLALETPLPTLGTGSAKKWLPGSPAMAAGLTDRVWSLQEVLAFRVPPWPQEAAL